MNNFYPAVDFKNLKKIINVFFDRPEMLKEELIQTLLYLKNKSMSNKITETVKLLEIFLTIPMCSYEDKRLLLSFKSTKMYLLNTL